MYLLNLLKLDRVYVDFCLAIDICKLWKRKYLVDMNICTMYMIWNVLIIIQYQNGKGYCFYWFPRNCLNIHETFANLVNVYLYVCASIFQIIFQTPFKRCNSFLKISLYSLRYIAENSCIFTCIFFFYL